ncbi:conjugative transfer protein MobI(A/C) [Marinobacter sp.]|uniref:conjugative transfer protein MobI(A/C) n=1 Tax=Marinobacter sp. TaxID=50741 RepID=UPI00261656F9|nr:conjugative transfer protein MobI(A/C) [Marinobacter sp.]
MNRTQLEQRDIYVEKGCKEMGFKPEWFEQTQQTLSEQEALITQEAQELVDSYWAQIKERKRSGENEGRLGVRLIDRQGYKIQIVWYRKQWVGPKDDKKLFSKAIPKGRIRNRYPMQRFAAFAKWEQELVEMYEDDFAALRTLSGAIADQRKAMSRARKAYVEMGYLDESDDEENED